MTPINSDDGNDVINGDSVTIHSLAVKAMTPSMVVMDGMSSKGDDGDDKISGGADDDELLEV